MQPFKPLAAAGCCLRQLTVADLAACLHLDRQSLGGLWNPEQWQAEFEQPTAVVLGVESTVCGQLLGVAAGRLVVDELQITAVAVQPHQRRRGLGRWLLETLLAAAAAAGGTFAVLEVDAANTAARALYGCLDFKVSGLRRSYYRDGSDAVLLRCDLGHRLHS